MFLLHMSLGTTSLETDLRKNYKRNDYIGTDGVNVQTLCYLDVGVDAAWANSSERLHVQGAPNFGEEEEKQKQVQCYKWKGLQAKNPEIVRRINYL